MMNVFTTFEQSCRAMLEVDIPTVAGIGSRRMVGKENDVNEQ
jgi:hypothetical protein